MATSKKERRWSFKNASGSPFELWVSTVTFINVIAFIIRPDASPVHHLVYPWDFVWAFVYAAAGGLIFTGLVRNHSSQYEAAGLLLLMAGILVQLIVFGTLGVSSLTSGTWGSIASLITLIVTCVWRFRMLTKATKFLQKMEESC